MNIYLIDYENTNGHGLYGLEKLGMFDKVFIFYTENANSLHFEHMEAINKAKANVKLMLVEAGRENSLDFQLSSFLGFQISKHPFANFFVVTKDKGYTCLEGFWRENNRNVKILPNIAGEEIPVQPKNAAQKKKLKASNGKNKFTAQKPKTKQSKTIAEPKSKPQIQVKKQAAKQPQPQVTKQATKQTAKQPQPQVTKQAIKQAAKQPQPQVTKQATKPIETKKAEPPVKPAKNTEELCKMVLDIIGDRKDAETITNILIRSKAKVEIHTKLQQKFNSPSSNRATDIYREILPIIPEDLSAYSSFSPFMTNEPNAELVDEIKKYVKKQRNAEIIADILTSSKTNEEVHSKLQHAFNAESPTKADNIFRAIKPLLPEQPQQKKQVFESKAVNPSYDKELFDKVFALIENESDAKIIAEILATTETKQEIHEKLQKAFNSSSNNESGLIYKKIKPLLPRTPSKADESNNSNKAVDSSDADDVENTATEVNNDLNSEAKDIGNEIISENALNISNTLIVDDSL